ncbi:MAG: hypothetical protein GY720_24250 [bacterium]|nr:hypothetical protein [bacterium]
MSGIVCALRGGPGSYYTRRAGLERSTADDIPLYLLIVIPAESYGDLHEGEQRAIRAEMAWRELALARATASQLGQPDAQFNIQVRIGDLRAVVSEFTAEVGAGNLLLGTPRKAADAVLSSSEVAELAGEFQAQLGITVDIIRPQAATTG